MSAGPQRHCVLVFLGIALLFPSGKGTTQLNLSPENRLQVASEALKEGRYDDAICVYLLAAKDLGEKTEIMSNLGIAYYLKGEYRASIVSFEKALAKRPDLVTPNLFLGIDYLKLNLPKEAIPPLKKVLRLNPENPDARLALGAAYLGQRRYLEAIREFERVSQTAPENPETWYQLGKAYLKVGDDATHHLWELDPDLTSMWARLLDAEILMGRGRHLSAESSFSKVLSENPHLPGAHADVGWLYLIEGYPSKAEEQFQQELKYPWMSLAAWYGLVQSALTKGDPEEALIYLDRIIQEDPVYLIHAVNTFSTSLPEGVAKSLISRLDAKPSGEAAIYLRSFLYRQVGNSEGARKYFREFADSVIQVDTTKKNGSNEHASACGEVSEKALAGSGYPRIQFSRLSCLYYRGALAETFNIVSSQLAREPHDFEALFWSAKICQTLAISAFQRLADLDPNSYRTHQLQGQIYRAEFRLDEAAKEYEEAIRLMPNLSSLHLELGMLYMDHAKYDLAITEAERALALSPGDPETNYVLGELFLKTYQPDQAIPFLQAAVGKDTEYLEARLALAKAYRAKGRVEDAIEQFRMAIPLDRSGEIHYQLSNLYRKTGHLDKAQEELQTSEKIRAERLAAARKRGVYPISGKQDTE